MPQTLEEKAEMLDIVDDRDKVIGRATREEVNRDKLSHRIVHVLVHNDLNEMAMQMRSMKKSYCPGHWSTAVGGYVRLGETYEQAGARESFEELGKLVTLRPFAETIYVTENGTRKFLNVFEARDNGPFKINPDEVEKVEFFSMNQLSQMLKSGAKIHPELRFVLDNYVL